MIRAGRHGTSIVQSGSNRVRIRLMTAGCLADEDGAALERSSVREPANHAWPKARRRADGARRVRSAVALATFLRCGLRTCRHVSASATGPSRMPAFGAVGRACGPRQAGAPRGVRRPCGSADSAGSPAGRFVAAGPFEVFGPRDVESKPAAAASSAEGRGSSLRRDNSCGHDSDRRSVLGASAVPLAAGQPVDHRLAAPRVVFCDEGQ